MKINKAADAVVGKLGFILTRALVVAGFLFLLESGRAQGLPGGSTNSGPTYTPLASWSFHDYTNWTSDKGYAPISFTNLDYSYLGNGHSLVVNSTNPAWLQFNAVEANGTNNLTVDAGTVMFWFASSWSSTNAGGTGPGAWARLFEVGSYTPDSSYGWWSLFVDEAGENIYFAAQTNDLSSNVVTYLSAPISWKTNYFHAIALTYSATNTALYLDGSLATNGPPLTVYPGAAVLTKGFFIGSDSNGLNQAQGLFNNLRTYRVPLDGNTIGQMFDNDYAYYMMSPLNTAMFKLWGADYTVSLTATPNIITGQGNLQVIGSIPCVTSTNLWLTNVTATVAGGGMVNVTFGIGGGQDGLYYDVFANSLLAFGNNAVRWAWQGQGLHCLKYSLTLPVGTAFLILGTPQDSDLDGLTDAYEKLVSKTDPDNPDTDGDGTPDGWEVLLGMNPLTNDNASSSSRANFTYDFADWLNQITGIKSGNVNLDNEGNVTQATQ